MSWLGAESVNDGERGAEVDGAEPPASPQLRLLGGFDLRIGGEFVAVPLNVRRLLALLAVRERPQARSSVAHILWMDTAQTRATANLRSTLWKLGPQRELLRGLRRRSSGCAEQVEVDLTRVVAQAKRLDQP